MIDIVPVLARNGQVSWQKSMEVSRQPTFGLTHLLGFLTLESALSGKEGNPCGLETRRFRRSGEKPRLVQQNDMHGLLSVWIKKCLENYHNCAGSHFLLNVCHYLEMK